jgi:hypothetical protein
MARLTKHDKEDLTGLLREYLKLFKTNKNHQKSHKKKKCPKCDLAEKLLRKL